MLLTIAWAGSLLIGRCDLDDNGESIDGTGQGRLGLTDQVSCSISILLLLILLRLNVQLESTVEDFNALCEARVKTIDFVEESK